MIGAAEARMFAIAEVVAVAAAYIAISLSAVAALDLSTLFSTGWSVPERATGADFLLGAFVQVALVLIAAYILNLKDVRDAIKGVFVRSTRAGWTIAGIATAIHIGTAVLVFLPRPALVLEPSVQNVLLSAIPAADGWSQEVVFRGYVLYRLARAGVTPIVQIALSGLLFASIHIGYIGDSFGAAAAPLVGTFMLGCFYAWAVQMGRGSLKPVVCFHVLIIVMLQPWLALARFN